MIIGGRKAILRRLRMTKEVVDLTHEIAHSLERYAPRPLPVALFSAKTPAFATKEFF